ncbi:MAG: hypothetical protein CR971_01995 [candidate division SR1 bacterium]|nr:MAG: hypothetical protein CR971_01995 [candidate division SR1 bacterium]
MQQQDPLKFYEIMNYPVPTQKEFFYYKKKVAMLPSPNKEKFSRNTKSKTMQEYIEYIKKYNRLYRSLPFVEQVFLCNSLTFNAVNNNSDIDLFFICKSGAIRRARFFSVLFFTLLNLKRGKKNSTKKFCLTFYITKDNQRLSDIKIKNEIYLPYWIQHLILLYNNENNNNNKNKQKRNNFFKHNQRVEEYLPNYQAQQLININISTQTQASIIKRIMEIIFNGKIGILLEKTIKSIWKPLVIRKKEQLKQGKKYIIIEENMLKFYLDKREDISEKFYR